MARWASLVEARRRERPTVLLDTGDFYFGADVRHREMNDRYLFRSMRLLGYDAAGVGESELRIGLDELRSRAGPHAPPLVAANLLDRRTRERALPGEIVKEFSGVRTASGARGRLRVGVFAVVFPPPWHRGLADGSSRYAAIDPKLAALESAARLRADGCHVVVAISHLGWEESVALAREVPGIDVVLNGHRTGRTMRFERAGRTAVVETGAKEQFFTEVTVIFGADSLEISASNRCPDALATDGHPKLLSMQKRYSEEVRRLDGPAVRGGARRER
ncbi:MAG: hypothetical protein C4574_01745 [Candidatus Latescibacterota bacterium]|nr:MAG: hypothetical protein C4574_01745 [Candidatus Latescibacterota bacterium]